VFQTLPSANFVASLLVVRRVLHEQIGILHRRLLAIVRDDEVCRRLTPAETRLASTMATDISIERVADQLGLSRATVRNQLKAVFAKTATNRQSELVALLSRL
jgi:DNA-binding CsgD family transcriptional regulator